MTEWQILDSDNFPDAPPDSPESPQPSARRRWLLLGAGLFIFLVGVGFVTLRERLANRRAVLRDDLAAVIFEEETQQFLGNIDQSARFQLSNSSRAWQSRYRQTFASSTAQPPGTAQLKEVDFNGSCAVAKVDIYGSEQTRVYCLEEQTWRRAPVSPAVWGEGQQTIEVIDGVKLSFRPRDQVFAQSLAKDLQYFYSRLDRWRFNPGSVRIPNSQPAQPLEIIIEPVDLHPPLIANEVQRIVINSPALVPLDGIISGQAAVRVALAEALLSHAGPFSEISEDKLPGSSRFLSAAQTVVAARLLLSPNTQTLLRDAWRSQLAGSWVSPFFAELSNVDSAAAHQSTVAAWLTADYITQSAGPATLAQIIYKLPLAESWDDLFQSTLQRSMIELEAAVQMYHFDDAPELADQLETPDLPLTGNLLRVEIKLSGSHQLIIQHPDLKLPLLVELPADGILGAPSNVELPANCLPAGSEIEVDGVWLERQYRVNATKVTALHVEPFAIPPAAGDTVAYLINQPSEDNQRFEALYSDGTLQPLLVLSSTVEIFPLPIEAGGRPHFLLILEMDNCKHSWFIHYRPEQGVIGAWLAPPFAQWVWRADHQDFVLFTLREDSVGHEMFVTDESMTVSPHGYVTGTFTFLGWNLDTGRLVATSTWFGEIYIGQMDFETGNILPTVRPRFQPLRLRRLSYDGKWLAYLAGFRNLFGPPDRLDIVDMETDSEKTLIRLERGEGLWVPIWPHYVTQKHLVVLSGPVEADQLVPIRLLLASPNQPDSYQIVAQAANGEQFGRPVFCADGALLYAAENNGQFRLQRQRPGLRAKTVLTLDNAFTPLACY